MPEKKSLQSRYGKISVPERHVLCQTPSGFRMTAYWQERCLYMGQEQVFEEASACIERLTGTAVTAKQIERLCHCYGELAQGQHSQQADVLCPEDCVSTTRWLTGATVARYGAYQRR